MSKRTAGFRLSVTDVIFIGLCAAGGWFFREPLGPSVGVIPMAAGHFFLFCNVFRVRRSYELAWVGVFLCNVAGWALAGRLSWWSVLAVQAPFTLLAIGMEMRSPQYHGIFCSRVHPKGDWQ